MSMNIDPQGGHSVEISPAVGVEQIRTLTPLDDERRFGLPFLHLGEGMPEVLSIPAAQ
jgi:hypothetical protein